jgi:hypothetical protein
MMHSRVRRWLLVALFGTAFVLPAGVAAAKDAPSTTPSLQNTAASGDPVELVQATAAALASAGTSRDDVARALDAIGPLAAQRKTALATTATQRRSLETHLRAADMAFKRYRAASAKAAGDPKTLALLETARSEYETALAEGERLEMAIVTLRKLEDQLAIQLVASTKAAATADHDATSSADTVKGLKSLAAARGQEAKAAADGAATAAGKAASVAGLGQPSGFVPKKAKAEAQDRAFSARVSDARTALARVAAAMKP